MLRNILLADDHNIVRSGIKAILQDHFSLMQIDEAESENEVIEKVKAKRYHLILLDINMPGSDFVGMMEWLKINASFTHIVVFSMYPEEVYGKRCLNLGAKGFLHKTATNAEIILAINKVLNGGDFLSSSLLQSLDISEKKNEVSNPFDALSARELEIAFLIKKGSKLPEICTTLNIQYSTANTYKRRIFEKLKVSNAVMLSQLMHTFHMEG